MISLLLIFLIFPAPLQASCLDNADSAYNIAVSQGDYQKALHLVAGELHLTPEQERRFKIIQGFSYNHDDRHGQADPETLELRLDPGLFIEGKEGACQGMAHELAHLRQFRRDRRRFHAYFSKHPVPEDGWKDCDREELAKPPATQQAGVRPAVWRTDSDQAEEEAYACLQDNDLIPHAAADDIEALLAQIPYATQHTLRDDDLNYLLDNLKRWSDHASMVTDQSNESYFLSEIKREDIRIFCKGTDYARKNFANPAPFQQAWLVFCRVRR